MQPDSNNAEQPNVDQLPSDVYQPPQMPITSVQPLTQPNNLDMPVNQNVVEPELQIISPEPTANEQFFAPNPVANEPLISVPASQTFETAPTNQENPMGVVVSPKKKKKLTIIGVIVAATLILLGGGAWATYSFWYSNPNKVISDALFNVITAKSVIYTGNVVVNNSSFNVAIDLTAKQANAAGSVDANLTIKYAGNDYLVSGSAIFDRSGDIYFKIGKLDTVASQIFGQAKSTAIDDFVNKINNKWIKITNDDIAQASTSYSYVKNCVAETANKLNDDKSALNELINIYAASPFINVDKQLGQKNGSIGYNLKIDGTLEKNFFDNLKKSKTFASLPGCSDNLNVAIEFIEDSLKSDVDAVSGVTELWVDSWSHQITSIVFKGTDDDGINLSTTIKPVFGQIVDIDTPTDSVTLAEIMPNIFNVLPSSLSTLSSSSDPTDSDSIFDTPPCTVPTGETFCSYVKDGETWYYSSTSDL